MNKNDLRTLLEPLPIHDVRYFEQIGSTNDEALAWAESNVPDSALVVANTQTKGRGRFNRTWITHPDSALAFSLILRPKPEEIAHFGIFTALGAVSICKALENKYQLKPRIKWPNDVLLDRKKTVGILVEASWMENVPQAIILGIGVNIASDSVPPADQLLYPATCIEEHVLHPVDRWDLLREILNEIFQYRKILGSKIFIDDWENRLAFAGEQVRLEQPGSEPIFGQLKGIDKNGNLRFIPDHESEILVSNGEIHLRPLV
jgi:BirA family biotin operon repressor/biotin-[acetyl-CoA-carboxylase] ligase